MDDDEAGRHGHLAPEQVDPPGAPREAPEDRVSLAAFAFSLVGVGIVAVPLAIWGLVRTTRSEGRGRGYALAALGISAAWAVVAVLVVVTVGVLGESGQGTVAGAPKDAPAPPAASASSSSRTGSPTAAPDAAEDEPTASLRAPKQVYWEDLEATMCVRTDPGELAPDVTVVDCRADHEEEVMARTELAGPEEWPGDQAVDDAMDAACDAVFARYIGIAFDDSRLEMDEWTVDQAGWRDSGRTLVCLVLDPAEPLLDHALQSSRRESPAVADSGPRQCVRGKESASLCHGRRLSGG